MEAVDLINVSLHETGNRPIAAISDTTPAGLIANDVYIFYRDLLLRAHNWNFATARAELTQLTVGPEYEYEYAYALPDDYIRTVSVNGNDAGSGQADYRIESVLDTSEDPDEWKRAIITSYENIWIKYVRRVDDPDLMSEGFRQGLIYLLNKVFATKLASSNTMRQLADEDLKSALRLARSIDGIEDVPDRIPEGSWANSRRRSGRGYGAW